MGTRGRPQYGQPEISRHILRGLKRLVHSVPQKRQAGSRRQTGENHGDRQLRPTVVCLDDIGRIGRRDPRTSLTLHVQRLDLFAYSFIQLPVHREIELKILDLQIGLADLLRLGALIFELSLESFLMGDELLQFQSGVLEPLLRDRRDALLKPLVEFLLQALAL